MPIYIHCSHSINAINQSIVAIAIVVPRYIHCSHQHMQVCLYQQCMQCVCHASVHVCLFVCKCACVPFCGVCIAYLRCKPEMHAIKIKTPCIPEMHAIKIKTPYMIIHALQGFDTPPLCANPNHQHATC